MKHTITLSTDEIKALACFAMAEKEVSTRGVLKTLFLRVKDDKIKLFAADGFLLGCFTHDVCTYETNGLGEKTITDRILPEIAGFGLTIPFGRFDLKQPQQCLEFDLDEKGSIPEKTTVKIGAAAFPCEEFCEQYPDVDAVIPTELYAEEQVTVFASDLWCRLDKAKRVFSKHGFVRVYQQGPNRGSIFTFRDVNNFYGIIMPIRSMEAEAVKETFKANR